MDPLIEKIVKKIKDDCSEYICDYRIHKPPFMCAIPIKQWKFASCRSDQHGNDIIRVSLRCACRHYHDFIEHEGTWFRTITELNGESISSQISLRNK